MRDSGVVDFVPALAPFQLFRRDEQVPGGVAEHALVIGRVVHIPFARANVVEQETGLLEEEKERSAPG